MPAILLPLFPYRCPPVFPNTNHMHAVWLDPHNTLSCRIHDKTPSRALLARREADMGTTDYNRPHCLQSPGWSFLWISGSKS